MLSNEGDLKTVMLLVEASVGQLMNWSLKLAYESFVTFSNSLNLGGCGEDVAYP